MHFNLPLVFVVFLGVVSTSGISYLLNNTTTPTSSNEEGGHNFPRIDDDSCGPLSSFPELETSVCARFLQPKDDLLGFANVSNRDLETTFRAWDALLPSAASLNSTHGRCIEQAKRLTCLLAFPRCHKLEYPGSVFVVVGEETDDSDSIPVCRQHCLVVTSLLCASSLSGDPGVAPLTDFPQDGVLVGEVGTGWAELVRSASGQSHLLGNNVCARLPLMETSVTQTALHDPVSADYESCQPLDFDDLHEDGDGNKKESADTISDMCFDGTGINFRGKSGVPSGCLPWSELDHIPISNPLISLSPTILPIAAFSLPAPNEVVCRNPLGLNSRPFCVGYNSLGALNLMPCSSLIDCVAANLTTSDNHTLLLLAQKTNVILITASICSVFGLWVGIVIAYIVRTAWRTRDADEQLREEQKSGKRRVRLVTRRARLRQAPLCWRFVLRCAYSCADTLTRNGSFVCRSFSSRKQPRKTAEEKKKPQRKTIAHTLTDVGILAQRMEQELPVVPSTNECVIDDEDEEVEEFRGFLQNVEIGGDKKACKDSFAATTAALAENQLHLTPILSRNSSEDWEGLLITEVSGTRHLGGSSSSDQPSQKTSLDTTSSLLQSVMTEAIESRKWTVECHLENAFVLASVGKLMHPRLKELVYPRKKLIEERVLGRSAFGHVVLARAPKFPFRVRLSLPPDDESPIEPFVVVKTLKFGSSPETEIGFFREAELLVQFNHQNILKVLGICVPLQPLSLIMEYMRDGDLTSYLHQRAAKRCLRSIATDVAVSTTHTEVNEHVATPDYQLSAVEELIHFALDVCEAMIYLSSRLYVHRDLATRNCLVGLGRVKLADFSMSCRLPHNAHGADFIDLHGEAPLAVRWLPLESILEGRFNIDTDVWSFGVFLWELFAFGRLPYGNVDVSKVIRAVSAEKRLPRPLLCPSPIYKLMLECWSSERNHRPSFGSIRTTLREQLQKASSSTQQPPLGS